MTRVKLAVACAVFSAPALFAAPEIALAQAGCQPTIMQPCTDASARPNNAATGQKKSTPADDDRGPKDHSPRVRLDNDTELKFGTGGIGLGRRF
jgi:hypothetical protein